MKDLCYLQAAFSGEEFSLIVGQPVFTNQIAAKMMYVCVCVCVCVLCVCVKYSF